MARVQKKTTRRASRSSRRGSHYERLGVRGFVHLQIIDEKTGKIVGEHRGFNVITTNGKDKFIVGSVGGLSGNLTCNALALATKTDAISSGDNTIAGETGGRKTLADTTNSASNRKQLATPGTLQMIASWAGSDLTGTATIGSIAAFNSSSGGSMACAATFTASQWTTDQSVLATYELRFS